MNSKGDNGNPCMMPLNAVKNLEGVPLSITLKFTEERQPIIQLTPPKGTPICNKTSLRYDQFSLSKAFTKSSLRIKALLFLVFTLCKAYQSVQQFAYSSETKQLRGDVLIQEGLQP